MKYKLIAVWVALMMLVTSCSSIMEEQIDDEHITVLAPADNIHTNTVTVTFWWDILDGADQYRVQVVKPSFDSTEALITDSLVTGDKLILLLSPGHYQWRIRGENSAYQTAYTTRSFTVDSTSDLSGQTMLLTFPPDNHITSQHLIKFDWQEFDFAEDYRFEIASPDFNSTPFVSITLTADTFSYYLEEGLYQWRVRAQNTTSITQYTTYSLTIDTTGASAPQLTVPADGSSVTDTVTLQWTSASGTVADSLFIYADSLGTNAINVSRQTVTSVEYINPASGFYYWRVKSVDGAGNTSPFSSLWKFFIQP